MMLRFLPGRDRPFTGAHMLAVVGLFFGTVIGVNLVMATVAVRTFPGLNAKNGYVASQTYNLLLDDAAAQEERGWRAEVGTRGGALHVKLRDRSGAALHGLTVTALAGRPATASADHLVKLFPT
jgi:nitrogen fixation protein FixH